MATPVPAPFNWARGLRSSGCCAFILLLAAPLRADVASIRQLLRGGRFAEAAAQCDRELSAAPRSVALLTLKGLALQAGGDKALSLTTLRQALAIDPNAMAALQAAAQLEFEARDPQARQRLESILRLAPATPPARAMLATVLFEARDCAAAMPHLMQLPPEPAVRWQRGICHFELQQWAPAAAQFTALLQLRDHGPTRFNLALAQFNSGNSAAAIATLQPLTDLDSQRLLAAAHVAARHTGLAIDVLQKAIEQHPADERLLIDLGIICIDHKAWPLGAEVLEAGLRRWPQSARLHTLLGVLHVRAGEVEKGQASFQMAEQLSPASGLGQIGLASTLMQMGLAEDAVRLLRPQSGGDARVDLTLARALLQAGGGEANGREAERLLESVVQREPANAAAYSLLGKLRVQRREWPQAEKALLAATRLDAADRAAHYQLMILYQRTGRTARANETARKLRVLGVQEQADEEAANRFRLVRSDSAAR